jgi:1-deoxy-D-xylulose-5-phosphate reductoisomerase
MPSRKKRISLLGSTGSIGKNTLRIVRHLPEELEISAIAARSNIEALYTQALEFRPKLIAVFEPGQALLLQKRLPHIPVLAGMEGLQAVASFEGSDFTMLAMTGSAGLLPAVAAIESGKQIGLANKEILVCGGEWISGLAKRRGIELLPVDSEHCALHQCLLGSRVTEVRRLILTASGGALRDKSFDELKRVSVKEALTHPNWQMGSKVTVDCTTLMNKGLEIIEARFLFDIAPERIEAVIHPQSRIHSCVEFIDGSILAQIADPDMALPIQYALTYPKRRPGLMDPYDFLKNGTLSFYPPDPARFPCLQLAIDALKAGKSYPCFLNAANEVLVDQFLKEKISWMGIGEKLQKLIASHRPETVLTLESILAVDAEARRAAETI